jgi:hypothetical protein
MPSTMPHLTKGAHLSLASHRQQQPLCYRRRLLPHRPFSKPLRLVSVSHNAGMRRYCWQHLCLVEPVNPPRVLRRSDILGPAVIWVRSNAMDRDDAIGKFSICLGDSTRHERTYSIISVASAGALRSTFRPMSSSVTGRTWFRVSLSALHFALDPPLPFIRERVT